MTRNHLIICISLAIATLAVYWQIQDHEFINFDDNEYITENTHVKAGFTREGFIWAFTKSQASNWHPITWLSHMVDCQLYGLNPKGHHLTNLFFHTANSLLLFIVLSRMTGTLWQSGFVAVLFALHPLHVETVAWAAERKDVLSMFFMMLTLWAYIFYIENPGVKKYLLVVLFFALGLMSKPMLVTLPFILLLLDYWPLGRLKSGQAQGNLRKTKKRIPSDNRSNVSQLILEKLPLFILAMGSSIVTFLVQQSGGATKSLAMYSIQVRITNALISYLEYLEKMVWPTGLAVLYPHPGDALSAWKGMVCGVVLVFITTVVVRMIQRAPYLAVGWFWYLGTLVPVIGIVQVGSQAIADRYTYIPLIGIFIIIAWGLPQLIENFRYKDKVLIISGGILIPLLMVSTWSQTRHWKNSTTLYKHAIEVNGNNYPSFSVVYYNLGNTLVKKNELEEAISHYKMAIKINPEHVLAYNNLGNALSQKGDIEGAISQFKTAIKIDPQNALAHDNLGVILDELGEYEKAIAHYKTAIQVKPDFAGAHYNLGNTLTKTNEPEEAIRHYKLAIKIDPEHVLAHTNLGNALAQKGLLEDAITQYQTAIKIKPDFSPALTNLEMALSLLQNMTSVP
jgi:protein O-mannosyl-transferase